MIKTILIILLGVFFIVNGINHFYNSHILREYAHKKGLFEPKIMVFLSGLLLLTGIDLSSPPSIYTDLVYYCSITLTTIGYGDITPLTHHTKLTASLFGITGQFYQVMIVGVLISKFVNRSNV